MSSGWLTCGGFCRCQVWTRAVCTVASSQHCIGRRMCWLPFPPQRRIENRNDRAGVCCRVGPGVCTVGLREKMFTSVIRSGKHSIF